MNPALQAMMQRVKTHLQQTDPREYEQMLLQGRLVELIAHNRATTALNVQRQMTDAGANTALIEERIAAVIAGTDELPVNLEGIFDIPY